MDFIDLVKLVISREKWIQSNNFKEDAANAPQVHFVSVVTVSQQTLRRSVPSSTYVLSVGLLTVYPSTAAKICELNTIIHYQNIFRLNVPVENTVFVHMVYGFQQLEHVVFDSGLGQVMSAAFNRVVEIHIHQLKHQR